MPHNRQFKELLPPSLLAHQAAQCLLAIRVWWWVEGRTDDAKCNMKEITAIKSIHLLDRPQHGGQEIRLDFSLKNFLALFIFPFLLSFANCTKYGAITGVEHKCNNGAGIIKPMKSHTSTIHGFVSNCNVMKHRF